MEMPIQAVLKTHRRRRARARKSKRSTKNSAAPAKCATTLGEDDKVVRALYAAEVLKTPLSSLDAKWPKETGVKTGEAPRVKKKAAPKVAQMAKASKPAPPKPEKKPAAIRN